jgi:hypothetical protein
MLRMGMASWFDCSNVFETEETAMKMAAAVEITRPDKRLKTHTFMLMPYI